MQQANRSGRAARSSRAHVKHQPASASDSNTQNTIDSRPPSEKPAPKPSSARQPPPSAPPRGRRTHSRHRKSKNRPEPNLAAVAPVHSDRNHTDHSAPPSASNTANEAHASHSPPAPIQFRKEKRAASLRSDLPSTTNPAHQIASDQFASSSSAPLPQLSQQQQSQNQHRSIQQDLRPASNKSPSHQHEALFQPVHSHPPAQPLTHVPQPSAQPHRMHPEQRHAGGQPNYQAPLMQHVQTHSVPVQPVSRQVPQQDQVQAAVPAPRLSSTQPNLQSQNASYADVAAHSAVPSHSDQPIAPQPLVQTQANAHAVMHAEAQPHVYSGPCDAHQTAKPSSAAVAPQHISASQSVHVGKQALVEHSSSPCESQQSFVFAGRAAPFNQVPYQLVSPTSQPSGQRLAAAPGNDLIQESAPNTNPIPASDNASVGQTDNAQDSSVASDGKPRIDCDRKSEDEVDRIAELVSRIKAPSDGPRPRPLICQDITNSNADTLRISRLPRGVTYDRLYSMVEPFGDVEDLVWVPSDPYVCEVTYRDPAAAHEAKHFLGDALVGSDAEPPLKVELYSRDPGAQLFVGDLTPDVTEEMLEAAFSKLVGEPVTALLKRDPDSFSPIGYGFLSFKSESSANFALVAGHRAKIGNACVRVGRAERNTYLYISDLSPNVTMSELKEAFGKFGSLVEEDTVIVKRTYAFVRYKNRNAAEKAKRTLDKTDLKGRLSVRYAEAEPLKACVAVQFHSSVPRPPNSLRDLLTATFSKHGNCSVEIPRLANGMWRKVAFVTFHGDPMAANLAALEAVQSIRFVSSLPVCCQFARELIPRLPSKGLIVERGDEQSVGRSNYDVPPERVTAKLFPSKRSVIRRSENVTGGAKGSSRSGPVIPERRGAEFRNDGHGRGPNYVPVYVPVTALQHPNTPLPPGSVIGNEGTSAPYHWSGRVLVPGSASEGVGPHGNHLGSNYNSFGPDRYSRW